MSLHDALTLALITGFAIAIFEILRDQAANGTKESFLQTLCSGLAILVTGLSAIFLGLDLYLSGQTVAGGVMGGIGSLISAIALLGWEAVGVTYQAWQAKMKRQPSEADGSELPPNT
jgi:hypothetical protein